MEGPEIQKMFRLAAEVRKMAPDDPRREQASNLLEGLTAMYMAENVRREAPPRLEVGWKEAVSYVAALFAELDRAGMPDAQTRAVCFEMIAAAMTEKYGQAETPEG